MNIEQYRYPPAHDKFSCEQSHFIGQSLKDAPVMFHRHIERRFNETAKSKGLSAANLELLKTSQRLKQTSISLVLDDDAICKKSDRFAKECGRCIAAGGFFAGRAYTEAKIGAIPEKKVEKWGEKGTIARISDAGWWRRQLRVKHGRAVEGEALALNIVNRKAEIYSSSASVTRRRSQKTRNRMILEEVVAVNELGQEYTLAELSDLSVSNPAIRRGELMTRIAGFEQYAQRHGHTGVFWTVTCPSRMHSALSKTGGRNPKYDGTTPKQAQAYLSRTWARVRAVFQRRGINPYGMRVAEPQHDGTPHWHMLVFLPDHQLEEATEIYREYALQVDGGESGANKYRFDSKLIDWRKGTAAGYIAKYIAKNIDAYGVDYDLYGKDAEKSVERVDAWASTWGIRQFQQVGGPSVSVWRELRRMDEQETAGLVIDKHRAAADCGDWFAYIEQMKKAPVTLLKAWNDKEGKYLEPIGEQIIGVELGIKEFITRKHSWRVEHGKKQAIDSNTAGINGLEGVEADEGRQVDSWDVLLLSGASASPWSSVNNCTQEENNNNNKTIKTSGGDSP